MKHYMTRRDALHYGAILVTYLSACILVGAMDVPHTRSIAVVDKPSPVLEERRKELPAAAMVSIGTFTCYAYCSCPRCCGEWSGGPTASGTIPQAGRTVAADWSVLPSGTELYIDGLGWRTVEDTGSGIRGDKLDLYMESHEAALEFGVKEVEVFVYHD